MLKLCHSLSPIRFLEFSRSGPAIMTSWSSSIKIWFLQAYRIHYSKICHGVKQNAKICAIGETECNES